MEPISLTLENFLSHENTYLNLQDRGLVLVEGENLDMGGSNAAGKSSLFDGILWALFGSTSRNILADGVVKRGCSNTKVTFEFLIDGKHVKVVRHRQHKEFKNKCLLFINGEEVTGGKDVHTESDIYQLTKLDQRTFISAVMHPQQSFGFAAGSDADKKQVFETILGFERFTKAQNLAKEKCRSLQSALDTKQSNLHSSKQQLDRELLRLQEVCDLEDSFEQVKEEKIKKLTSMLEQLFPPSHSIDLVYYQSICDLLAGETSSKARATQRTSASKMAAAQALEREYTTSSRYEEANLQSAKQRIVSLQQGIQKEEYVCPSCGQELTQDAKQAIDEERTEDLQRELSSYESAKRKIDELLTKAEEVRVVIQAEQQKLNLADQLLQEVEGIQKIKNELEGQFTYYKDALRKYEDRKKELSYELDKSRAEESPYTRIISKIEQEIGKLENHIIALEAEIAILKTEVRRYNYWVEGFSNRGVKSLLLDFVIPFLNERSNLYLAELTQSQVEVNFTSQSTLQSGSVRDKIGMQVICKNGGDNYGSLSGGERCRINVAIFFALGDLAEQRSRVPVKLKLLDEPFDGMDSQGKEAVAILLNKFVVPKAGTVLVMTHQDDIKRHFDTSIVVTKERGTSRISEVVNDC